MSYEPIEVISQDKKSRALSTSQIVGLKSLVAKKSSENLVEGTLIVLSNLHTTRQLQQP